MRTPGDKAAGAVWWQSLNDRYAHMRTVDGTEAADGLDSLDDETWTTVSAALIGELGHTRPTMPP